MGNIGKMAKIELLVILAPLNGVFGGNSTPYPQEGNIRDILSQNWKLNFRPFQDQKCQFLAILSLKHKCFSLQHLK